MAGVRLSRGFRLMAGAAFFLSLMALLVRVVGERLPTMELVLARSVYVLVFSWVLLRRAGIPTGGNNRSLLVWRGLFGFAALSCYYFSLTRLPLAEATVIHYTNPIWTALLAALVLSERMDLREIALSLLSLAGVAVMARPAILFGGMASGLPAVPVIVALTGAALSGAAYVTVRSLGRSEHPLVVVYWLALISTVGSVPFVARALVWPTPFEWVLLTAIGVTTFIGQILITMGLREERAGKAMGVAYLQVVFAATWGIAFLSELPNGWTVVGAALVLAGSWALGRARPGSGQVNTVTGESSIRG